MFDPVLPDNWLDVSLNYEPSGHDASWERACIELLRECGERSLASPDVQSLVVLATGLRPNWAIRESELLAKIPDFEWAIQTAWSEPGRTPFTRSSVWHAMQEIRAIDDELAALKKLGDSSWRPVCGAREEGQPDWLVRRDNIELPVEVKSKGEASSGEAYLKGAFNALLLLDLIGGLRKIDWHFSKPGNSAALYLLSKSPQALDMVVYLMFENRESVSKWLFDYFPSSSSQSWSNSSGTEIRVECWEDSLELVVTEPTTGAVLTFCGEPRTGQWRYSRYPLSAGWELHKLTDELINDVAEILRRTLKDGQIERFPADTLYFVRWHAPLFWTRAFQRHPQDSAAIAERVIEPGAGTLVAIWISSLLTDQVFPNAISSEHFAIA